MNQINYQIQLEKIIEQIGQNPDRPSPKLLLHSCCAPCSSYVLEYLCSRFDITVFYFNPNISSSLEYQKRVLEQKRLIEIYNRQQKGLPIHILEGDYVPEQFLKAVRGLELCPEGGERCFLCYRLRLTETALMAKRLAFDFFGTTLTISPLKNAKKLNEIGMELEREYGIAWLPSDFKKKNGYKRSIELSGEYDLYRQDFCGCSFSRAQREREKAEKSENFIAGGR